MSASARTRWRGRSSLPAGSSSGGSRGM